MNSFAQSLGINAVVFVVLMTYMKLTFDSYDKDRDEKVEERKATIESQILDRTNNRDNLNKLCDKIERLIDIIHETNASQLQARINTAHEFEKITDMYVRMSNKVDAIHKSIEEVKITVTACSAGKFIERRKDNGSSDYNRDNQ